MSELSRTEQTHAIGRLYLTVKKCTLQSADSSRAEQELHSQLYKTGNQLLFSICNTEPATMTNDTLM